MEVTMDWKQLQKNYPDEPLSIAFLKEHLYHEWENTYELDFQQIEHAINRVISALMRHP